MYSYCLYEYHNSSNQHGDFILGDAQGQHFSTSRAEARFGVVHPWEVHKPHHTQCFEYEV